MPLQFSLQLVRVECVSEAHHEPGKDEMNLLGFGVTRSGRFFSTGFRSLGSYGDDDLGRAPHVPQTMFEARLPDDGHEVLFSYWLVEKDWGDVGSAAGALETEFRNSFSQNAQLLVDMKFPRECIPFTAFFKTVPRMDTSITSAAWDLFNSDDVFAPADFMCRFEPSSPINLSSSGEATSRRSKNLGEYLVTFRFSYHRVPEILG